MAIAQLYTYELVLSLIMHSESIDIVTACFLLPFIIVPILSGNKNNFLSMEDCESRCSTDYSIPIQVTYFSHHYTS
jgi:hypothetical protein